MNSKYAKRLLRWAYALYYDSPEVRKTLEMCVDKQVPEEIQTDFLLDFCPDCHELIRAENQKFCCNCGQALKFPEVK